MYGLADTAKVNTARMVARRIAEGKLPEQFRARDLLRKQWADCTTLLQVEAVLSILEEHRWVLGVETENMPGRPTTDYLVNPNVRKQPSV